MTLRATCQKCGADGELGRSIVHRIGCDLYHVQAIATDGPLPDPTPRATTPVGSAAGAPGAEPVCQDATDPTQPCRFTPHCHVERRRIQSEAGLRGAQCWAYDQMTTKFGSDAQAARIAAQQEASTER